MPMMIALNPASNLFSSCKTSCEVVVDAELIEMCLKSVFDDVLCVTTAA